MKDSQACTEVQALFMPITRCKPITGWIGGKVMHYPIMLNLEGRKCLVVGAGDVGRRKATEVLISGASVRFLDTVSSDGAFWEDMSRRSGVELDSLQSRIIYTVKMFEDADLEDIALCFAATSDRALNEIVTKACDRRRILVNVADAPSSGSFIVPSIRRANPITVAVYSDDNPAASRFLADRFVRQLNEEFRRFVAHTHGIRMRMKTLDLPSKLRQRIMKTIYQEGPADMALNGMGVDEAIHQADVILEGYRTEEHTK